MQFQNYNDVVEYVNKKFPKKPPCNAMSINKSYCKNLEFDKIVLALKDAGYNIADDNRFYMLKDKYTVTKI